MGEKAVVKEEVPWKIIIPFLVVFITVATYVGGMLPGVHAFWSDFAGNTTGGLTFTPGPFFIIVLTYFLFMVMPSLRKRISEKTLVYIFASASVASILSSFRIWSSMLTFYHALVENFSVRGYLLPWFWFPSPQELQRSTQPNMPFSSEWYVPMVFSWMLLPILLNVYLLLWTNLFRRQWVDVERLTFPYATPVTYLIKYHYYPTLAASETRRFNPKTLLLIFFILGIIYNLPPMLAFTFTWFPDIYSWAKWPYTFWVPGCVIVASDPTFAAITSRIAGFWAMNVNLVWAALIFFAPSNTLLTTLLVWLLILIATQVAAVMGYYPGWETSGWRGFQYGPPLATGPISMGLIIGLVLFWVIFNRKYLGMTLRLAMGKGTPEEKQLESGEALSYRNNYIGIIALFLILCVVLGVSDLWRTAPLLLIFMTINLIALSRVHAYGPFYLGATGGWGFTHGETKLITAMLGYPDPMTAEAKTTEYLLTNNFLARPFTGEEGGFPFFGSVFYQGPAFKMARGAEIHPKNMFKVILISIALALIIGTTVAVFMWNYAGLMNLPVNKEWDKLSTGDINEMNASFNATNWWGYGAIGIVIMGLVYFLHSRFLWFWPDPAGVILGFSNYIDERVTFLPILIAFVIKYIIFKVGGTKLYEDVGVPCAIGFLSGYTVVAMINNIAAVTKFYFPY